MIKENKKNKLVTFLCACLMVCASALGLVSAVGTTLASSSTQPTITVENFTNYALYNNYDYVLQSYVGSNTTGLIIGSNAPAAFSGVATSYSAYTYSSNAVTDITSQITKFEFYKYFSSQYFKITYLNNAGATFLAQTYFIVVAEYNGVYYYCISNTMNTYRTIYNQGLADADTTSAYNNGYNTGYAEGQTNGYNTGVTQGQNNVINNPNNYDLYTQAQYEQNYTNGYNSGVTQGQNNVINNPNSYGLYTQEQYQQNYTDGYNAGVTQGQNNVINNPNDFGLNTNQQLQDSYNQGFADGEQSSDAYQNGYDIGYADGSNEVLNNPNNYNLYTQAQYEQNYTDGYNKGLTYARYGIYADITAVVKYGNLSANNVINEPFAYYLNGLIFSENVISMFPPDNYQSGIMTVEINFNNDFVYTNDDFLKFFLPQTRVANIEYNLIDINNNVYTYVSSVETTGSTSEDRETIFSNGPKVVDGSYVTGPVPSGSIIKSIEFTLINPNYYILTQFYLHQIDNGYDLGYTTGFDQGFKNGVVVGGNESYQTGYNNGSVDGFNSGYAQGLANQDNATFASMISAVIDVPINAMRNLFNFELLGINLFGFFTALFTLLVVITIIRLILGGK